MDGCTAGPEQPALILSQLSIIRKGEYADLSQVCISIFGIDPAELIGPDIIRCQLERLSVRSQHPAMGRKGEIALLIQRKAPSPGIFCAVLRLNGKKTLSLDRKIQIEPRLLRSPLGKAYVKLRI